MATSNSLRIVLNLPEGVDPSDIDFAFDDDMDVDTNTPSWTSRNGKTKSLTDMKSKNLRGIKKNIEKAALESVFAGIYDAICNELDERAES